MRHSIYLHLAVLFVKADLHREENKWRRQARRTAYHIPWDNEHLLRDIGLERDGRCHVSVPTHVLAERRVRRLRQILTSRIPT